jgi:hypothetical protein
VPPRYHDISVRQSKARLDYDVGGSSARYADAYPERLGRSHAGYSSSRSVAGHDTVYSSSRHGMSYGGSVSTGDAGGMYSSTYSADYMPRGSDVSLEIMSTYLLSTTLCDKYRLSYNQC